MLTCRATSTIIHMHVGSVLRFPVADQNHVGLLDPSQHTASLGSNCSKSCTSNIITPFHVDLTIYVTNPGLVLDLDQTLCGRKSVICLLWILCRAGNSQHQPSMSILGNDQRSLPKTSRLLLLHHRLSNLLVPIIKSHALGLGSRNFSLYGSYSSAAAATAQADMSKLCPKGSNERTHDHHLSSSCCKYCGVFPPR